MPAEFQKAIDLTLTNCTNTYAYLDDILIITKGSIEKHKETLEKVLHRLDEENLEISLDKCKFACKQIEWLGFHKDGEKTTPRSRKTDAKEKSRHMSSLRCIYKQTRRGPKTKHKRGVGSYCVRIKIPKFLRRKKFSE